MSCPSLRLAAAVGRRCDRWNLRGKDAARAAAVALAVVASSSTDTGVASRCEGPPAKDRGRTVAAATPKVDGGPAEGRLGSTDPVGTFRQRRLSLVHTAERVDGLEDAPVGSENRAEEVGHSTGKRPRVRLPMQHIDAEEVIDRDVGRGGVNEEEVGESDAAAIFYSIFGGLGEMGEGASGTEGSGSTETGRRRGRGRPFPRSNVGICSAHGIEPHPFMIRSAPPADRNPLLALFSGGAVDRKPHLVSVTTKKINQDRGRVTRPYCSGEAREVFLDDHTALFAAYDGHGERGELIAEYVMKEVQERLRLHPSFDSDVDTAALETFREIDQDLREKWEMQVRHFSGSHPHGSTR